MHAVDTLFVGHIGAAALSGVALGGMATFTLLCFGLGLLRACKIAVAQAVGAGRHDAPLAYLGAALWIALVLGVAVALLGQALAWVLPLLTASAEAGQDARVYASLRLWAAPLVLLEAALRETRQGAGDTRGPMNAALAANIVNAGLVALFLHGFHWGVAGVAWATTAAQILELALLAWFQREEGFGLRTFRGAEVRSILRLGAPLGVERFFDVGSFSVMIAIFARMGDIDLAAHQVANQAVLIAFLMFNALGETCCILVGQAVGAASLRTVVRVQRAAVGLGLALSAVFSCAMLCFGAAIGRIFTQDEAVIARAVELFRIGGVFVWFMPLYVIGQSTLRSVGDVRAAAWITVAAAWGCTPLFAAFFGLKLGLGAPGGWIGLACEVLLATACFWWRLLGRRLAWVRKARRIRAELRVALQT